MESVKAILDKCKELWDSMLTTKKWLDELQVKLTAQKQAQETEQIRLDGVAQDLTQREIKVAQTENLINLNNDNKRLLNEIKQQREKLITDTASFNRHVTEMTATLTERTTLANQQEKDNKDTAEKLDQDRAQLIKDREEFKTKLLEQLAKNIR